MNIRILHLLEGARAATGLTVIIDVFRAYSLEAYLLDKGAERIIPVADAALAYRLKSENPSMLLAGERGGRTLPGFDLGNSPARLMPLDVRGKTVIHTTSAGTQGIASATQASEILAGSLVTARATASYIKASGQTDISLVAMGLDAAIPTEEDTLCAEYIKALLEGKEADMDMERELWRLRTTSGAKFFDPEQSDVFPEGDFHLSTDLDRFDFVLKLERCPDGMDYIRMAMPSEPSRTP
jgi:2-phosphosulfolactate phosphatase